MIRAGKARRAQQSQASWVRAGAAVPAPWKRLAPAGLAILAMLAGSDALAQAEQVLVKRPAELREAPGDTSRTLASLPVQTPVTRLGERQGPWIKVSAAPMPGSAQGTVGWLHMFDVGAANTPGQGGNAATGALRSLTGFFNKGSAQAPANSLATSTVGIRGLGAEDIASAQPNPGAVGQAEALRADAAQARSFAQAASLQAQAVDALPEPPRPRAAPTPATGGPAMGNTP